MLMRRMKILISMLKGTFDVENLNHHIIYKIYYRYDRFKNSEKGLDESAEEVKDDSLNDDVEIIEDEEETKLDAIDEKESAIEA